MGPNEGVALMLTYIYMIYNTILGYAIEGDLAVPQ